VCVSINFSCHLVQIFLHWMRRTRIQIESKRDWPFVLHSMRRTRIQIDLNDACIDAVLKMLLA
jgi:hypothetical protein